MSMSITLLANASHIIPIPIVGVTLFYAVLKLAGYLALSWWFIVSPIIVSVVLFAIMMAICFVSMLLKESK